MGYDNVKLGGQPWLHRIRVDPNLLPNVPLALAKYRLVIS